MGTHYRSNAHLGYPISTTAEPIAQHLHSTLTDDRSQQNSMDSPEPTSKVALPRLVWYDLLFRGADVRVGFVPAEAQTIVDLAFGVRQSPIRQGVRILDRLARFALAVGSGGCAHVCVYAHHSLGYAAVFGTSAPRCVRVRTGTRYDGKLRKRAASRCGQSSAAVR